MATVVRFLTRQQCLEAQDSIARVYGAAFAESPYCRTEADVRAFRRSFATHIDQLGFCFVGAFNAVSGVLKGFAYGRTASPGQWWHDVVLGPLTAAGLDDWLVDSLNLVEFAVTPAEQGRGIGSALHDALLDGVPHRRAVLSTRDTDTPAFWLYRNRGWRILIPHLYFPGVEAPYRIMGKAF